MEIILSYGINQLHLRPKASEIQGEKFNSSYDVFDLFINLIIDLYI